MYKNRAVDKFLKNIAVGIVRQEFNEETIDYFFPAAYRAGISKQYCAQNFTCRGEDFIRSRKGETIRKIFEKYLPEYLDYGRSVVFKQAPAHS
jgi:hypothetical protein